MAKILDGHIHIMEKDGDRKRFTAELARAGVDGGIVISLPPASFNLNTAKMPTRKRIENLLSWKGRNPDIYPFYWIDPLEKDACRQVMEAVNAGVAGFKVICNRFYPADPRAFRIYRAVAGTGRPILFHSGILWDNRPGSSIFNRPVEFEKLLGIENLKFALAHISWPWCDELIAVYGKFCSQRRHSPGKTAELFVDLTPGTPIVYRKEVLTKLLTTGYPVRENILFGSDSLADNYESSCVLQMKKRDCSIYNRLRLDRKEIANIFGDNLQRFLGLSDNF